MEVFNKTVKIWIAIVVLLVVFGIISYLYSSRYNKYHSLLILPKPTSMDKIKTLDLNNFEKLSISANTTQFTLLTWMFINPLDMDMIQNKTTKEGFIPLSNVLCKGEVDTAQPLILFNHYTNNLYVFLSVSSTNNNLSELLDKSGPYFWTDLEKNPENYPNVHIVPNILVGRWFHFGMIVNGSILELYVNAKLSQSIILNSTLVQHPAQNKIHLGDLSNKSSDIKIEGLKGELSQLRYYPRVLTTRDIYNLYEKGLNEHTIIGDWVVSAGDFINRNSEKYIFPIPNKIKREGLALGRSAESEFKKLGNHIADSNLFIGARRGLGKGLMALKKGDLANRLLYGSQYKQSVPYLVSDKKLLASICNRPGYMPNPLPSAPNCLTDCDCVGMDKCGPNNVCAPTNFVANPLNPSAVPKGARIINRYNLDTEGKRFPELSKVNSENVNQYMCNYLANQQGKKYSVFDAPKLNCYGTNSVFKTSNPNIAINSLKAKRASNPVLRSGGIFGQSLADLENQM